MGDLNVWFESGDEFRTVPGAKPVRTLPAGVYDYHASLQGWHLHRVADQFEFPFDVMTTHQDVIDRVAAAMGHLTQIGVLFNGMKGAGKTVTAQQLANIAIEQFGAVVIRVSRPIDGIGTVLGAIEQPLMCLFDEFEKVYAKIEDEPDPQVELLSAVDGLSRSEHRRIFLFTTNEVLINASFVDRPSRIRYAYTFNRLPADAVVRTIDALLTRPAHRAALIEWAESRSVISLDAVRTAIEEVNLFDQSPFDAPLNASEAIATMYDLALRDLVTGEVVYRDSEFAPLDADGFFRWVRTGQDEHRGDRKHFWMYGADSGRMGTFQVRRMDGKLTAKAAVPVRATWLRAFPSVSTTPIDLDHKPEGWAIPSWASKTQAGKDLTEAEEAAKSRWYERDTVYGTGEAATYELVMTPLRGAVVAVKMPG